jgi:RNAse (barnase) inhibitor barstar
VSKVALTIDGERFSTLDEFYEEVSRKLIPGAEWGRNLDAFNDILRGGFGTPEEGFVLVWRRSALSRERLGYAETIRHLERRLLRCHPSNRASFMEELSCARRSEGPTCFDWLVEIIQGHSDVELELQ